ncbi:MAG: RNA polymerase sigma factor [Mobilitalea sp.]
MTDFSEIYHKFFKDVYKYLLSLCKNPTIAEELTQETFFKALNHIDEFDGKCKLYVWLCQIAKNTYFSYYKKENRYEYDVNLESTRLAEDIEQSLLKKETAFEIHKVVHTLEEPYKEVFILRLFSELSFAQIAELFGKTESWARVTYHRARLKIKEDLI